MRLLCLVALILLYSKAALVSSLTTTVLPPIKEGISSNGTQTALKPTTEKPNQKCYVCYSCSRVETSQSLSCQKGMNQCIVSKRIYFFLDKNTINRRKQNKEKEKLFYLLHSIFFFLSRKK